ncbi:MAG: glycerol-3-phosphate dehydrogenase [Aestuariivita sp.]|nr:glycerol-3-phosphate dehydrogenase [Aestuariivita sp.]
MNDIVIIGGGIAGISAAARLAPSADVIVLEAERQLAYHASGRSAAAFIKDYGNSVVRALNAASVEYLTSANGGVLGARGMMMLGKAIERKNFLVEADDFGLAEISIGEAKQKVPLINHHLVKYAAYREDVSDIDTDLLFQNFLRIARSNGAKVQTDAQVTNIRFENGLWHLTTANQTYSAKVLVNASGAWVDQIAEMAGIEPLGFTPYRRSIARIPVPGGYDPSNWPLLDGVKESWYAKPDAGQLIVSPADEDPVLPQDAWADDIILAEGLSRFEEMMSKPVERVTSNWAGLRTFAPDRTLVIGRSSENPEFFWIAGQGGYGFQTAAAVSQLSSDLILGHVVELDDHLCQALSPDRFKVH